MRSLPLVLLLAVCFSPLTACGKKKAPLSGGDAAVTTQPPVGTVDTSEEALLARFFDSTYTLCDAHFVSKTFGMETRDSKAYIGQKIAWGTTAILDGHLATARERGRSDRQWRCQFYQTGISYEDLYALANFWGMTSSDAKVRIEDKILWGNERYLRDTLLPEARAANPTHYEDEAGEDAYQAQQDYAAFSQSKYDACHARMLIGTYFGQNLGEIKDTIGYKVGNGWGSLVEDQLNKVRARHQVDGTTPCYFHQTPYTYDDAEALAALWGQTLSDAKARIESKYAWGSESILPGELERARISP